MFQRNLTLKDNERDKKKEENATAYFLKVKKGGSLQVTCSERIKGK